jgi:hypothetical protein
VRTRRGIESKEDESGDEGRRMWMRTSEELKKQREQSGFFERSVQRRFPSNVG